MENTICPVNEHMTYPYDVCIHTHTHTNKNLSPSDDDTVTACSAVVLSTMVQCVNNTVQGVFHQARLAQSLVWMAKFCLFQWEFSFINVAQMETRFWLSLTLGATLWLAWFGVGTNSCFKTAPQSRLSLQLWWNTPQVLPFARRLHDIDNNDHQSATSPGASTLTLRLPTCSPTWGWFMARHQRTTLILLP